MSFDSEVLSVGNLNIDIIGKLSALPRSDEKVLLDEFSRKPGGGGANFAAACSKLGLDASFIGCVGNDSFGREVIDDLEERGVNTSLVERVEASTGMAFIFLTPTYERLLIEYRGANSYLDSSQLEEEVLKKASLLHASSVTPEMAVSIGNKTKKLGLKSSLDLGAELTQLEKQKISSILKDFDICFMNGETFEDIFDVKPSEENVFQQHPEGLDVFVVTKGSQGAIVTNGEESISGPTYDVEIEDTTGAGDTFAAVFNRYLLDGASLDEAVKYATAGAAIKIQKIGAREGIPTREEIENFVKTRG